MHAFLFTEHQPYTIESHHKNQYEGEIKTAFRNYWPTLAPINGNFYGVVYYFHKKKNNIDADNICKPVFDALKNELYVDDDLIKLVRSATFDLASNNIDILDLTKIPDNVSADFLKSKLQDFVS
jgi:Holliday junction resolvase RusA-like endonuclease